MRLISNVLSEYTNVFRDTCCVMENLIVPMVQMSSHAQVQLETRGVLVVLCSKSNRNKCDVNACATMSVVGSLSNYVSNNIITRCTAYFVQCP